MRMPRRPATNGVAGRAVRTVAEGTRCVLEQAGLPVAWWPPASRAYCFLHNITEVDGDSCWNEMHGNGPFVGERIPFGSAVIWLPTPKQAQEQHKADPKGVPGIFMGYKVHSGYQWRHEYLVMSIPDVEEAVAHPEVVVLRRKVQTTQTLLVDQHALFRFPFAPPL